MGKKTFILYEIFQAQEEDQRKERFQKQFERYIADALLNPELENPCE